MSRPSPSSSSLPPVWTVGASNEGAIDLQALLHATEHDVIAYAAGTLHVGRAGRYYILVAAIAALSYGLIYALTRRMHWNVFAAKVTVDVLLSLVSFSAQRTFVFRKSEVS